MISICHILFRYYCAHLNCIVICLCRERDGCNVTYFGPHREGRAFHLENQPIDVYFNIHLDHISSSYTIRRCICKRNIEESSLKNRCGVVGVYNKRIVK